MPLDTHLSDSELHDLLLGNLPDAIEGVAESHLAECPACQVRAASARTADTFVQLVTAAGMRVATGHAGAATPQPESSASATVTHVPPGVPNVLVGAPPGLIGHPRYKLVRRLGAGGMGDVWLAEHAVMGRPVALKVIRPEFLSRPGAIERFHREVRAVATLHHPNIATAFDADEAAGTHFLVMEYVPGASLSEVVKRGPLPVADACRAIRDAARGLAHAHAAGLIHRDIKPANLVRTIDGTTKVLDFGLVGAGAEATGLTGANMVMGTPDYIAPEQATDAHSADARSDVYSLGCTLYHLLAGRVPFPVGTAIRKIDAHRDPDRAPAPVTNIPEKLARVLARMTAKDPAARYQTAQAVADALSPFCVALDEDAPTVAAEPAPVAEPARPRSRRKFARAAGLVFALAVVFAGGVVYKVQRDNEVITVTTDDPDIEVAMRRNGELVRITDTKTKQTWELDTKRMRLRPDGSELSIDVSGKEPLVIRRNGDVTVTVQREPVKQIPDTGGITAGPLPQLKLVRRHDWSARNAFVTTFSPDGKYYAATGDAFVAPGEPGVRVWETASGDEVLAMPGAGCVTFAPDSRTVFTYTANDSVVRGWNIKDRKQVAEFKGHALSVTSIVAAADGKHLVTSSPDKSVRIWDIETKKELHALRFDNAKVPFLAPAGGDAVFVYDYHAEDPLIRLVDLTTGKTTRTWRNPERGDVLDFRSDPTGKNFVTVRAKVLRVWATDRDTPVRTVELGGAIAFSPDLHWLAHVTRDNDLQLLDLGTGRVVAAYRLARGVIGTHAISADGRYLVVSSFGPSQVYLFELPAAVRQAEPSPSLTLPGVTESVVAVAFSPDGKYAAAGGGNTWTPRFGAYRAGTDYAVRVWEVETGKLVHTLTGLSALVDCVVFAPNGERIAASSGIGEARVWDTKTGKAVTSFVQGDHLGGIAFTPDGKKLLAVGWKSAPRLWDANTGKEDASFKPDIGLGGFGTVALSPDGKSMVVGGWGYLATSDAAGKNVRTLAIAKDSRALVAAYSRDGSRLVSCDMSDTEWASCRVRVWDTKTGKELRSFVGRAPAFQTANGSRLLTAGLNDNVLTLWDVDTGREVERFVGHASSVLTVAVSPDGKKALSGSLDNTARLWKLPDTPEAK